MTIEATVFQVESTNFTATGAVKVGGVPSGIAIKATDSMAETLLAYWPLGSEGGTDRSGNGRDATISGVAGSATGITGQSADDFRMQHSYAVPALPAVTDLAVSCWVFPRPSPDEMSIFSIGDLFSLGLWYGRSSVSIYRNGKGIEPVRGDLLSEGRGYHLATRWQENGEVAIFVDGVLQTAESIGYGPSVLTSVEGQIGNFRGNQPLSAILSDVRIWTGIAADQLAAEYAADVANWVELAP